MMMLSPNAFTAFADDATRSAGGLSHRVLQRDSDQCPLVIINAMASPMTAWGTLPDEIKTRTVILLDPPGIGASPLSPIPYSADQLAGMITDLVTELGYDVFDLFGYSWGGFIAQHVALDYPNRVHRLVLAGCGPTFSHGYAMQSKSTVARHTMMAMPELIMSYVSSAMKQPDPRGSMYQFLAAMNLSIVGRMAGIVQPTLIMAGTRDPISPAAHSKELKQGIPNSRLQVFEAGHFFPTTLPQEVAAAIEAHLTD